MNQKGGLKRIGDGDESESSPGSDQSWVKPSALARHFGLSQAAIRQVLKSAEAKRAEGRAERSAE